MTMWDLSSWAGVLAVLGFIAFAYAPVRGTALRLQNSKG
jgi:hypothetical protein